MSYKYIVLGTGHLGGAVVRQLKSTGTDLIAVNRFGRRVFDGVETIPADLNNAEEVARVCEGATAVIHCAMPRYDRWTTDFEKLNNGIINGVSKTGAVLAWGDNMYAYGRVSGPRSETTPENAATSKGKVRRELGHQMLEAHRSGKLPVVISRAADFYGPGIRLSTAGDYFFKRVLDGKPAQWLGDPDAPHSFTYIDDFAASIVTLAGAPDSWGQVWHAPTLSGISARDMVTEIARQLGTEARVSVPPRLVLRIIGLFNAQLRETFEMEYERTDPFLVDSSKFEQAFNVKPTELSDAVARTIAWHQKNVMKRESKAAA